MLQHGHHTIAAHHIADSFLKIATSVVPSIATIRKKIFAIFTIMTCGLQLTRDSLQESPPEELLKSPKVRW